MPVSSCPGSDCVANPSPSTATTTITVDDGERGGGAVPRDAGDQWHNGGVAAPLLRRRATDGGAGGEQPGPVPVRRPPGQHGAGDRQQLQPDQRLQIQRLGHAEIHDGDAGRRGRVHLHRATYQRHRAVLLQCQVDGQLNWTFHPARCDCNRSI